MIFIVFSAAILSAQECDISQLVMPPIFEDSAIGYGWGPFYQGIVIDSDGNVFHFNNPDFYDPMQPNKEFELSAQTVQNRYGNKIKLLRKLSPEALKELKQLIPEVFPQRKMASLSDIVADWEPNIQRVFRIDENAGKVETATIGTSINENIVVIDVPAAHRILELAVEK